jgi:hypothetical protein
MSGASGLRPHDHSAVGQGGSLATTAAFPNPMTTQDDVIVGGASGAATRLAKGSDGQVLTVDPSTHHLVWATPTGGGMTNPMTTLDDLILGGASGTPARLAKGSDNQVLTVDGTTHHVVWANPASGFSDPMTTRGDIIVRDSGNTTARLAKGAAGTYLGSDGTDVSYSAVTDAKLSTSDITTNNVSTSKHGFAPKGDGDATHYLDGTGAWSAPSGGGGGGSGALTFLSETVLGSAAADITVTGISGSYKDLVIVVRCRTTDASVGVNAQLRIGNGSIDTGSNYAYYLNFQGWTSGTSTNASTTSGTLGNMPNTGATAGYFGGLRIELLNYADAAKTKTWVGQGFDIDTNGLLYTHFGGLWKNTSAAVDQIRLYASAGNLDTGSTVTIYGRGSAAGSGVDASGLTTLDNLQALSDYVVGYDTSGAVTRGFPVGRIRMGRQHTVIADDCYFVTTSTVYEGGVTQQVTGTGAATSIGNGVAGRSGVIQIASGTSTTGRCSLASGQVTVLGGGRVRFGTSFQLSDLSNGTNTFTWRLGLIDNGGSAPSDAVMFRYTDSVNSGKWEGVCIASSVESTVDTGITADTSWHTFEFEVNAAATSVQFYIDGAATGAPVTTHIPTTNVLCHVPAFVRRSAGTGLLTGQGLIDAYWYIYEFTTAR